jgi:hypothetical protein
MPEGFIKHPNDFRHAAHVGLNCECVSPRGLDVRDGFLRLVRIFGVVDRDRRAGFCQPFRNGSPAAPAPVTSATLPFKVSSIKFSFVLLRQ